MAEKLLHIFFSAYLVLLLGVTFLFVGLASWAALLGSIELPVWLFGFGSLLAWSFRLRGQSLWLNFRQYVFVLYIIAAMVGFIWLMTQDVEAISTGASLRFSSWSNLWLGLANEPFSFLVFPLTCAGVLEAVVRTYQAIWRRVSRKGWLKTLLDFYFSDD